MRKIFGVLLSVLCICCAAIGLTGCKKDKHIHAFDKQVITDEYKATDATCTEKATYYYSCSCGEKGAGTFEYGSPLGHEYGSPSYIWGENYSECIAMTVCLRDSTHTVMEIAVPSSKITQNKSCLLNEETTYSAKFQNPLFEEQTKVIVSDKKTGHTYSDKWESDETNHWHNAVCEHTEETTIKENHSASDWIIDVEATYEQAGRKHKECIVCKKVLEIKEVAKLVKDEINFNTLVIGKDNSAYAKLTNEITKYNFAEEITTRGNATYVVSLDSYGIQQSLTKVVPLTEGNNTFYIFATIGDKIETYTITLRRRPIYTVSFYISDGMAGDKQYIEEDLFATEPQAPGNVKAGYTFLGWNYDFSKAITDNLDVNAVWNANTDTAYKVEYYLQNLENNNYTLHESFDMQGTTDTAVEAEKKTYEHFTLNTDSGLLNGKIDGDGSLVLRLYYTRNTYAVTIRNNDSSAGTIEGTFDGYLKYGKELTISAIPTIGHNFTGWYQWGTLFFYESEYTFIVETDLNITANWCLDERLSNLDFILTEKDCVILGVKDKTITSIEIPEYVTRIARSAFIECNNLTTVIWNAENCTEVGSEDYTSITLYPAFPYLSLTNVIIGDNVKNIPDFAFIGCSRLTSITIPDSVTSIGNGAFLGCSGLTSITIPDSVTSIGQNTFSSCGLTSVTIGKGVTSIGDSAFNGCPKLVEVINYSNLDIAVGSTDNGCVGYYALTVKKGGTSEVINKDDYLFYSYENINFLLGYTCNASELTLPNDYNGQNYRIYNYAFSGCRGLTNVTIGNGVTSIGDSAFRGCSGLTSITIPDSVTSIGGSAFSDCIGLTSITIPDNVTSIGNTAFSGCSELTNMVVADNNKTYHSNGNCIIETESKILISGCKNSIIPNDGSVTSIGFSAFENCSGLTNITIPSYITLIFPFAFRGCGGLTSVTIPDSITSIGYYAFGGCGLTSVTIGKGVTSIGNNAFNGCSKLVEVINNSNLDIATGSSDNGYVGYYALTVKKGGTSGIINKDGYLFYSFDNVNYLLGYVGNATELTLPNDYNGKSYRVYRYAFGAFRELTNITIPDGVLSIGDYAFGSCNKLTNITIPNSVTSIGNYAFARCSSLTSIEYNGTKEQWEDITKGDDWNYGNNSFIIHCTDGDIKISD